MNKSELDTIVSANIRQATISRNEQFIDMMLPKASRGGMALGLVLQELAEQEWRMAGCPEDDPTLLQLRECYIRCRRKVAKAIGKRQFDRIYSQFREEIGDEVHGTKVPRFNAKGLS